MIEIGDRVIYAYTHSLNSRSKTIGIKKGVFLGMANEREYGSRGRIVPSRTMALIQVDGNKGASKVAAFRLELERAKV